MLHALISSNVPFSGTNRAETAHKILTSELSFQRSAWTSISDGCKDLLSSMLVKDQKRRPSIKDVLQHPWFAETD
jgi:serine/threonine protein kinase